MTTSGEVADAPAGASARSRNPTIDGLKYVAAAGIVLHHVAAAAGGRVGSFLLAAPLASLFLFFAIAGYFHGPTGTRGRAWLRRRIVRLGTVYAIWTVIMLLLYKTGFMPGTQPGLVVTARWLVDLVFFAGAHGILWTLPMLIYLAVGSELVARTPRARRVALAVMAVITLAIYWFGPLAEMNVSQYQNFLMGSRYAFAYLAGMEIRATPAVRFSPKLLAWAAPLSVFAVGCVRLLSGRLPAGLWMTAESVLWIAGALILLKGADQGMTWFGVDRLAWGKDYLLGIYLTHVPWMLFFYSRIPAPTMSNYLWIPMTWTFCMVASTITVALLRSNRFTRIMVE